MSQDTFLSRIQMVIYIYSICALQPSYSLYVMFPPIPLTSIISLFILLDHLDPRLHFSQGIFVFAADPPVRHRLHLRP